MRRCGGEAALYDASAFGFQERAIRIPITMCHGPREGGEKPLPPAHLSTLIGLAAERGFTSIDYDRLAAWYFDRADLPARPILFDFDHALRSMWTAAEVLAEYGFRGNLFVHTGPVNEAGPDGEWMDWDELGRFVGETGWHIGSHTVTHPNLSKLSEEDPEGEQLRAELDDCDRALRDRLGIEPRDFAYTGTSFSTAAEREVKDRYRFGRLWIVRNTYEVDGDTMRYADLVDVAGPDEADGGPPMAARYITRRTPRTRLPSMEIQGLIHDPAAFAAYLDGATEP